MGREGVNNNNVAEVKNLAMELDVARLAGFALSLPCFAFFCYFFCWSLWGAQLKPCWTRSQVASHGAAPSIPVPQRAACERRTWGTTSFSWDPPHPSLLEKGRRRAMDGGLAAVGKHAVPVCRLLHRQRPSRPSPGRQLPAMARPRPSLRPAEVAPLRLLKGCSWAAAGRETS